MTEIELRAVTKAYQPGKLVLKPLDLTIHAGELFFLLGPSGCGKSTLLRLLAGFLKPDTGEIYFDGRAVGALPPEKRGAPMVFQSYALWPHLTVFENVAFGLRAARQDRKTIAARVQSELKLVQMDEYADRRIQSLSGGQQQRVALARALAVDPGILLLDEPLSNLDAQLRDRMRGELRRICKERRLTAVYVTHDRREALSMADRIAVLHEGVLQQLGTPRELYRKPANRFVAAFMGDANFIPGALDAAGRLVTACGDFTVGGGSGTTLMLRPEMLHFGAAAENVLTARLVGASYLGEFAAWEFETADGTRLTVNESNPHERTMNTEYQLHFAAQDAVRV